VAWPGSGPAVTNRSPRGLDRRVHGEAPNVISLSPDVTAPEAVAARELPRRYAVKDSFARLRLNSLVDVGCSGESGLGRVEVAENPAGIVGLPWFAGLLGGV
jgi:hypothetical protein